MTQITQDEMKRLIPQLADKKIIQQDDSRNGTVKPWWFPIELTNGNKGRGYSWRSKHSERKKLEQFFLSYFGGRKQPFGFPVMVVVTRILGKGQRLWDADSKQRGNLKEIVDALVSVGVFHDDGPKWISGVIVEQDATNRDIGPSIEITVTRSGL